MRRAGARAPPRTGTSAQLGPHFGPFRIKLVRKNRNFQIKKRNACFRAFLPDQDHHPGRGGLRFLMMAGFWKGDGQAGLCHQVRGESFKDAPKNHPDPQTHGSRFGVRSAERAASRGRCRRPWPWVCHGMEVNAADPASLDLPLSKESFPGRGCLARSAMRFTTPLESTLSRPQQIVLLLFQIGLLLFHFVKVLAT